MLVGNSLPEYIFTRVAILTLRLVAPVATTACVITAAQPQIIAQHRGLWPLYLWFLAEAAFFWTVFLPLRFVLQEPATHPTPLSKADRRDLFEKSLSHLSDPEQYLSKWFLRAPLDHIKRENVKEFYAWSFLNKPYEDVTDEEENELDDYVDRLEHRLERPVKPGRGRAKPLRTTLDPVPMQHRPLLWYLVCVVETASESASRSRSCRRH